MVRHVADSIVVLSCRRSTFLTNIRAVDIGSPRIGAKGYACHHAKRSRKPDYAATRNKHSANVNNTLAHGITYTEFHIVRSFFYTCTRLIKNKITIITQVFLTFNSCVAFGGKKNDFILAV